MRYPVAEGFYPGNKKELQLMLNNLFKGTKKTCKNVFACIAPHAGYIYSGKTAASVYANIDNAYDGVIILGPDHNGLAQQPSVSAEEWQTPLGIIKPHLELIKKLTKSSIIVNNETAHQYEHSIEVQLPFLQYVLKNFKIAAISIPSSFNLEDAKTIGEIIKKTIADEKILLVASSDMTHFGPGYGFTPVASNELEWIKKTDNEIIAAIIKFEMQKVYEKGKKTTACGIGPILSLMYALKGKVKSGKLIDYRTSYDVSKSTSFVVGYAGIVF